MCCGRRVPGMTGDISDRARVLLKMLVEAHIRDGQPVGPGTLQTLIDILTKRGSNLQSVPTAI